MQRKTRCGPDDRLREPRATSEESASPSMPPDDGAPLPATTPDSGRGAWRERLSALPEGWKQLVRFGLVGGLGTATNLVLFFGLVDLGGLDPILGIVVCFAVAVSQNYALNELWTFAIRGAGALSGLRYLKFVAASLVGLGVNTVVYVALEAAFSFPLKVIPQAVGIAAGTLVNFLASRYLVFQRSDGAEDEARDATD